MTITSVKSTSSNVELIAVAAKQPSEDSIFEFVGVLSCEANSASAGPCNGVTYSRYKGVGLFLHTMTELVH